MQVTFHRAFDEVKCDPLLALEQVISTGCHRILTSGCCPDAEQGIPTLRALQSAAQSRITILAGAGITPANAARIAQETGVTEIHGSCKTTLPDGTIQTDTETVKQLIKSLSL
jgi:copper homeostasis protein